MELQTTSYHLSVLIVTLNMPCSYIAIFDNMFTKEREMADCGFNF